MFKVVRKCLFLYVLVVMVGCEKHESLQVSNQIKTAGCTQVKLDNQVLFDKGLDYEVNLDVSSAIECYLKAANQGYAKAQYQLAMVYGMGVYVDGKMEGKNSDERLRWVNKAVEQNHPEALSYLGEMYLTGDGVQQNYKRAAELFLKAIEQGDEYAPGNLGDMYIAGQGVSKNKIIGYALINLQKVIYEGTNEKNIYCPDLTSLQRAVTYRLIKKMINKNNAGGVINEYIRK